MMVYLKRWIVCSSNIPLLPHLAHPPHYLDQRLLVVDGVGLAHVALRLARVPAVQLVPGLQWRRCSAAVLQCSPALSAAPGSSAPRRAASAAHWEASHPAETTLYPSILRLQ